MHAFRKKLVPVCIALVAISPLTISAQDWVIINLDPPLEGFNDATQRISDITGEQTTLGDDRLLCFQVALFVLGVYLDINTPIRIDARFLQFGGSTESAILAAAGPKIAFHDFFNVPITETWFTVAEANQLAGLDLDPDPQGGVSSLFFDDMFIEFNVDIDQDCPTCALGPTTWYYGIDGDPPVGKIDFLSTAMHEVLHGVGFLPLMDVESGVLLAGLPDIYTRQLLLQSEENVDLVDMTDMQRALSAISGQVFWKGDAIVALQGGTQPMYAPDPLELGSSISHWDETLNPMLPNLLMEPFKTEAFTDLTIERAALEDLLWPLEPIPGDPENVHVDFEFLGFETGAEVSPFNTAVEAETFANAGANILFAAGSTTEIGVFTKRSTWQSTGGLVRIGVAP